MVSNVAGVKMLPAIAGNTIAAPAITTFCANGDPAPITGSVPTGGDGTYSYQWQKSTDNISFTDISGAVGKNYDPGVITATTYYRRLVTSGSCIMPLAGNTVIVTVETAIAGNNITAPAVTSFCITGDASTITGRNPTGGNGVFKYQWQISTDNTVFKDIQGATLRIMTRRLSMSILIIAVQRCQAAVLHRRLVMWCVLLSWLFRLLLCLRVLRL
ncbi:hypothetical protein ACFJIV_26915 [Mucilaginibacter sp. UC70_90]